MANDEEFGDGIDDRYIWDGGNVLEILNSIDSPTERFLDGPAVDQVLAVEEVGGDNPGVNWLLADAQGTVRDVARGVVSGGSVSVSVVDHVIYDAYGRQETAQSATNLQYQTQIGFRGMLKDALADTSVTTHVSGGGGSGGSGGGGATTLGPFVPAASLYYSANGGWYDAVTETNVSGAAGNESGAVNAYEYSGNDPTVTGFVAASHAITSLSAVGLMGDPVPVYMDNLPPGLPPGSRSGSGVARWIGQGGNSGGTDIASGPRTDSDSGAGGTGGMVPMYFTGEGKNDPPFAVPIRTVSGSRQYGLGVLTVTLTAPGAMPGDWIVVFFLGGAYALPTSNFGPPVMLQNNTPFTIGGVKITLH